MLQKTGDRDSKLFINCNSGVIKPSLSLAAFIVLSWEDHTRQSKWWQGQPLEN